MPPSSSTGHASLPGARPKGGARRRALLARFPGLVAGLGGLLMAGCAGVGSEPLPNRPAHHVDGGFRNTDPAFRSPDRWTRFEFFVSRALKSILSPREYEAPRAANDGRWLQANGSEATVTWVGHATLLVQLDGVNLLTDPHWGNRASPFSWAGPRRLSAPGLAFEDLPPIHLVLISHDHYDQLDLGTVKRLAAAHDPLFLVPLGLRTWLGERGVSRVEELDWWEIREHRGLRLVCLPAQHWSQRTFWDRNRRLWASWAALGRERRFFFGGDSGYFSGFRDIGARLGPLDLAAIGIGAYMPPGMMRFTHTTPEQAVQAFQDLGARVLLGMHWATFDLAEEPLDEPPRRMLDEAQRRGIGPDRAWVLRLGETRRW